MSTHRWVWHIVCAFVLAIARCALGDGPATQASPATTEPSTQPSEAVATLISQLDAPEFGVREQAEAKLEEMGLSIEPDLKAAVRPGISDETRARLTHLIHEFDEARSMHASITIHCSNAPAVKVLEDFTTQAGLALGNDQGALAILLQGKNISLNLDNVGFWEGLRAVNDATGLSPYVTPTGITLAPAGRAGAPINLTGQWVTFSDGVLIEPIFSTFNHTRFYTGTQPPQGFLNVQFLAIPEPRLHVIGVLGGNWVKECVDEKGNSLVQQGFNRRPFIPRMFPMGGPRLQEVPLTASFQAFAGMGSEIAKLKGELALSIQTKGIVTQIPDITRAANTTKDDGQLSVTVVACNRTNMSYELILQIRGAMINEPAYQEFQNSVELLDDKGQSIQRQNFIPRPGPDGIRLNMGYIPTQATPAILRWERTLEQKRLTIPFEVEHLPLQ
jgi:hypothetical protein